MFPPEAPRFAIAAPWFVFRVDFPKIKNEPVAGPQRAGAGKQRLAFPVTPQILVHVMDQWIVRVPFDPAVDFYLGRNPWFVTATGLLLATFRNCPKPCLDNVVLLK